MTQSFRISRPFEITLNSIQTLVKTMTTNQRLQSHSERLKLMRKVQRGLRIMKQTRRTKTMKIRSEKDVCGDVC